MTGCQAACPHCGIETWWVSRKELKEHARLCELIEDGLLIIDVDSSLPETKERPRGWQWV